MGIITKKIGGKEYAYLAVREGKRVVHKYIGAVGHPKVMKMVAEKSEALSIPERFRFLFWDTNPGKIHLKGNARYVIERVLEFGGLGAVEWLQRVYPVQTILDVLTLSRNISEKSRNFWKIWFGAQDA